MANTDLNKGDETTEHEILESRDQQELDSRSKPFLGQWNRLISTTNWEKGAIIVQWQAEMATSDLPRFGYSDESWSRLVGGATPQHIGRLRRTHARFGHVYEEYKGLYWSHFYAALDWDDAEMWLEGALQNTWSVSQMRNKRWETMGKRPEDKPRIEQVVVSELDEESQSLRDPVRVSADERDYIEGPIPEGPDFGDEIADSPSNRLVDDLPTDTTPVKSEKIRPFESFSNLPDDISNAANSFKIAIIKHKTEGWKEIALEDLHGLLDALKALATSTPE